METLAPPKERPILFSGPMVKALLDGKKTQTRRVIKPELRDVNNVRFAASKGEWWFFDNNQSNDRKCPYGKPGDRLWVRETCWIAARSFAEPGSGNCTDYEGYDRHVGYEASMGGEARRCAIDYGVKKTPSIHMPRWASRITLEITNIRVERLNDISEEDAAAEGIKRSYCGGEWGEEGLIEDFSSLWESINGPGSWDANPWVWVIEFKPL